MIIHKRKKEGLKRSIIKTKLINCSIVECYDDANTIECEKGGRGSDSVNKP
jgi:hypothetical protein